jgi:hypothetical protein
MIDIQLCNDPKTHPALVKFIVSKLRLYHTLLGLEDYEVDVTFAQVDDALGAESEAQPEYRKTSYTFDLTHLAARPKHEVEIFVRHEVFHTWLWPYSYICDTLACMVQGSDTAGKLGGIEKIVKQAEETLATAFERLPLWDKIKK